MLRMRGSITVSPNIPYRLGKIQSSVLQALGNDYLENLLREDLGLESEGFPPLQTFLPHCRQAQEGSHN
jgi:hypothetical protein